MGCVYLATNRVNGKQYVGRTVRSLADRKSDHEKDATNGSTLRFHRSIRRYGPDAFDWQVLFSLTTVEELNRFEVISIKLYETKAPNGYNLTDGGDQVNAWTEESKNKLRKTISGHPVSEESRAKIRAKLTGRKCPEHSLRLKGRKQTEEANRKRSATMTGKPKPDGFRETMKLVYKNRTPESKTNSVANLKRHNQRVSEVGITDTHRQRLSESHKGYVPSEETKAKTRASFAAKRARRQEVLLVV